MCILYRLSCEIRYISSDRIRNSLSLDFSCFDEVVVKVVMSNIYIKEPPTEGKVLLHTTLGDIDIELWSKEAPIACRNFVQLCMEGYYDGVIFHRVVPGFIVQGGDPTGTGNGGESIYGKPFKDEFHQRLRFVRRGLVAMANAGANDNSSQFFFTLGACNDLNKKHTIFGKVTGDTVYNMIRLGEVDVGPDERPLNPPSIKWSKVIANPFDDIEPRVEPERKKKKKEEKKKQSQSRATKDYKLLSFGEEAEADEEESTEMMFKGPKSSHDLAKDPKLSATPAISDVHKEEQDSPVEEDGNKGSEDEEAKDKINKRIRDKLTVKKNENEEKKQEQGKVDNGDDKIAQMRKESRKIARELAGKNKEAVKEDSSSESDDGTASSNPMFADYKAQQKKYRDKTSVSKTKGSSREQQTLAMLGDFRSKMLTVREEAGWNESDEEKVEANPGSGDAEEDDDDDDDNIGWLMHKFKNVEQKLRDAKDMNRDVNEDRYDITDPRNTINKRRRDDEKKSKGDRNRSDRRNDSRSDRNRDHHRDRDRHRHHRR